MGSGGGRKHSERMPNMNAIIAPRNRTIFIMLNVNIKSLEILAPGPFTERIDSTAQNRP